MTLSLKFAGWCMISHQLYSDLFEPISCPKRASMISRSSSAMTKSFLFTFLATMTEGLISKWCFLLKSFATSSFEKSKYYLHKKNLSTLRKSSFVDKLKVTCWSQINQCLRCASLNCIMAAICWGSNSQSLFMYSGVKAFQTILAIYLIPPFATFRLTAQKRLNES